MPDMVLKFILHIYYNRPGGLHPLLDIAPKNRRIC